MINYPHIPSAGHLLISEPFMADPNFKRTVVLLCEHMQDTGTVGFILNKSLNVKVCDALMDFDIVQSELFYGGPVAQDTLHYLHRFGDKIEESFHVIDDIYWGGNFEQIGDMLREGTLNPDHIKFFLGYSGWSPGQLEEEMDEKSWLLSKAKGHYVFDIGRSELWKTVLNDLGGDYKMITNYPEDPRLN
ncbi:MAG TPA: YqgE/AlgH family protein [Chitinophagales bacterium]|nr:YqgE/AlgH family protein [Chitinophagales bacterium]HMU70962.1 YqgE/AlgH family protein [Chitinophagales bacterium]HMX03380.1 YqgE/AlgH family protein [Chitinophagales bacterium]HMZ89139.1 YqgE/AlgH family protein [Chitinophagales bacterium]HNA58858.1 YqgE/AlgH family protein [Chitinophagales bacterium]